MIILNCLWIGALAGLVASRISRRRDRPGALTSSIAVGILGALLGGLTTTWVGDRATELPQADLMAATIGAGVALIAWSRMQRLVLTGPGAKNPAEGR
jgi:uncharacterized membrane protein YeaQ/YmgE (transglycosylase-associated protein family)